MIIKLGIYLNFIKMSIFRVDIFALLKCYFFFTIFIWHTSFAHINFRDYHTFYLILKRKRNDQA
jgi:hypothetical protein